MIIRSNEIEENVITKMFGLAGKNQMFGRYYLWESAEVDENLFHLLGQELFQELVAADQLDEHLNKKKDEKLRKKNADLKDQNHNSSTVQHFYLAFFFFSSLLDDNCALHSIFAYV